MLGQLTQMTTASAQRVDAVSPAPAATGNGRFADHLVDARRGSDNANPAVSRDRGAASMSDRGKALPDRGQHSPHHDRRVNKASDNRGPTRADHMPRQANSDRKSVPVENSERTSAPTVTRKPSDDIALTKPSGEYVGPNPEPSTSEFSDLLDAADIDAFLRAVEDWQGGELSEDAEVALIDADTHGPVIALDDETWLAATEDGDGLLLTIDDLESPEPELTVETAPLEALLADGESGEALSLWKDNSPHDIDDVNELVAGLMRTLERVQQAEPAGDDVVELTGPEAWEQALAALIRPVETDEDPSIEHAEWSILADKDNAESTLSLRDWLAKVGGAGEEVDAEGETVAVDSEGEDVNAEEAIAAGVLATDAEADSDSDDLDSDDVQQTRSRRDRTALTESMLNRLVADGGRAQTAEENAPLRVNIDQMSSRDVTRQTTLDMAREHVERQLQVKNSAGELTQQLSERLVVMIGQDIQEARIRLDPPELGRMDVKVTTQNDQVQVQVVAQQPMVRDLLEQHAHRLREMLEQQGFTKVDVDVSDQPWQDGQDGEQSEQGGQGGPTAEGDDVDAAAENGRGQSVALGLVDHYV